MAKINVPPSVKRNVSGIFVFGLLLIVIGVVPIVLSFSSNVGVQNFRTVGVVLVGTGGSFVFLSGLLSFLKSSDSSEDHPDLRMPSVSTNGFLPPNTAILPSGTSLPAGTVLTSTLQAQTGVVYIVSSAPPPSYEEATSFPVPVHLTSIPQSGSGVPEYVSVAVPEREGIENGVTLQPTELNCTSQISR